MMTEAQLTALRILDPEDGPYLEEGERLHHKTVAYLVRYGLAEKSDAAPGATITDKGLRSIRAYVKRTGDGPERLKAMLRF